MTDHDPADEAPLDIHALGWDIPEPPSGFARRVVETHLEGDSRDAAPATPARRWTLWLAVAAAAAILIALPVALLGLQGGDAIHDAIATRSQQTVQLGDRAVAVAQAGTVMRWDIDENGRTAIEQDSGSVFYRVDHGEQFDVKTPAGTVTVTGTCFEVELVESMERKSAIKAGALGAALSAAVFVTVYEGGVVLANDNGSTPVEAGQRASAAADRSPSRWEDDDDASAELASADQNESAQTGGAISGAGDPMVHIRRQERDIDRLKAEKESQYEELERLREQVTELGGVPGTPDGPEAKAAQAKRCATASRGAGCPFLDPSPETLAEMARCASVKIDYPPFLENVDGPDAGEYARSLGLQTDADVKGFQVAADSHFQAYTGAMRDLFLELGGDADLAQDASPSAMRAFIEDQVDREALSDVQRRIAEERAGMAEPPAAGADLSIEERLFRVNAELGNDFEAHVARELGPEKARELRRVKDGWPGSTSVHSGKCRE